MQNIILEAPQQEYTEFMAMPASLYKNIFYNKNIKGRQFSESSVCYKEDAMYFSYTVFTVRKNKNSYYPLKATKKGFTFQKGKMSVWFGASVLQLPLAKLFEHLNCNWLDYSNLNAYLTKSVVEKILAGKITNNLDVLKAYMKTMHINASPKLLYETIKYEGGGSISKQYLLRCLSVAKDQNHALEFLKNRDAERQTGYILNDMIDEAMVLDRKIDFTWSMNRMREEHSNRTREIMAEEVKYMQEEKLHWLDELDPFTPAGFKLLKSAVEVFEEGTEMKHCLYTAYYNYIKRESYVAYAIDVDGERATVGYNVYASNTEKVFNYNQCYGIGNSAASENIKNKVIELEKTLNSVAKQFSFIKKQHDFYEHI